MTRVDVGRVDLGQTDAGRVETSDAETSRAEATHTAATARAEAARAVVRHAAPEMVVVRPSRMPGRAVVAGPLQALLDDPGVSDVLVNGPRDVWIERHGRMHRVDLDLGSEAEVRALGVRLAAACGERLDDAAPCVDGCLPDGTRLHAVLPPLARPSTLISLRAVRARPFTLDELVRSGSVAPVMADVLHGLVASRANVLVSGATGSGKTTLLTAALGLVPRDERIVVLEETHELEPDHPHVVRLVARRPNVDGAGGVDLAHLVRQALRMRPDRLVVGEARGAEVRDVLAALNTGHDGGWATVHANAASAVPARLEALGVLAGLPPEALAIQAAGAIDIVVHVERGGPGSRRVAEIARLDRAGSQLVVESAVTVDADGRAALGSGWDAVARRFGGVRVRGDAGVGTPGEHGWGGDVVRAPGDERRNVSDDAGAGRRAGGGGGRHSEGGARGRSDG